MIGTVRSHGYCETVVSLDLNIVTGSDSDTPDWDELLKFIHKAFAYMEKLIDPPSSLHRMTAKNLCDKASKEILVLAYLRDTLVGCMFCRTESDCLCVGKVAVSPQHQGQGIGKKMFETAFELAKQHCLSELELETRVELTENHLTFANLGFVQTGTSAHEGYNQPTSIIMRASV